MSYVHRLFSFARLLVTETVVSTVVFFFKHVFIFNAFPVVLEAFSDDDNNKACADLDHDFLLEFLCHRFSILNVFPSVLTFKRR